jgi:sRNA-binding protein
VLEVVRNQLVERAARIIEEGLRYFDALAVEATRVGEADRQAAREATAKAVMSTRTANEARKRVELARRQLGRAVPEEVACSIEANEAQRIQEGTFARIELGGEAVA